MSADSAARARFIGNLVDFCASRRYDGADFDWEFPPQRHRAHQSHPVDQGSAAGICCGQQWRRLTMAAVISDWSDQGHDYAALAREVDWFNLMACDFHAK